ncbi:MAG: rhodanese-related sulfurtransferase [Synechococcales bacterium]|nr:rhodanese-related sulfurtransferase [Synechococcales bacterium]
MSQMSQVVATFYKFVALPDCQAIQAALLPYCQQQGIKGTILLAQEGINGTISGNRLSVDAVLAWLQRDARLADLSVKESYTAQPPFDRLKVKIKPEIVTLGKPEINPADRVGTYVEPQDWNDLLADPEVVVIDTRNEFEVSTGSFPGAIDPHLQSFRQFPDYVQTQLHPTQHKKIAMFCTGGIRCEKASAYLLEQGFEQVYHLKGGILKYLEEVPAAKSQWQGECFVFDQRVTVTHSETGQGIQDGQSHLCLACGHPISLEDHRSPHYQVGINCPHCYTLQTEERLRRNQERQRQRQQQA